VFLKVGADDAHTALERTETLKQQSLARASLSLSLDHGHDAKGQEAGLGDKVDMMLGGAGGGEGGMQESAIDLSDTFDDAAVDKLQRGSWALLGQHWRALFRKRWINTKRDWKVCRAGPLSGLAWPGG
jgi:hypothetical protein